VAVVLLRVKLVPDKYAQTQPAWGNCHCSQVSGALTKALAEQHEPETGRVGGKSPKEEKQSVRVSETPDWLITTVSVSGYFEKRSFF